MSKRHRLFVTAATASSILLCSHAAAQVAPEPGTAQAADVAQQAAGVEDIVVTAQKRVESINRTPLTVTALSAEQLQAKGLRTTEDLARNVVGLSYTQSQFSAPIYTLRGVGFNDSSLAANPAVSVYVDEAPLAYPALTRGALLDLERVEVLKGPQGTLFGQNATGGAINYIAAKPTRELSYGADASYARFDAIGGSAFLSGPITSTLRARIAGQIDESGPWQRSTTRPNDRIGETHLATGRLLVDWYPSNRLRLSVNINGWVDRSDNQTAQFVRPQPQNPANPLDPRIANAPVRTDARSADFDAGVDFDRSNEFYQGVFRSEFDIAPDITITSITAYARLDRDELVDTDGTPARGQTVALLGKVETFTNEMRIAGKTGAFDWIVGGNYEKDTIVDRQPSDITDATNAQVFGIPFGQFVNQADTKAKTGAVFGNGSFHLNDRLTVEGGVRYTDSRKDYRGCTADSGDGRLATIFRAIQGAIGSPGAPAATGQCVTLNAIGGAGAITGRLDEDNVSWRAGVNWRADGLFLFANTSRGYKSGNFPILAASSAAQLVPATQERVQAYEAGFKWTTRGRTVQINGSGFYYDYADKQQRGRLVDPVFGLLETLVNIPKSRIFGGELQTQWAPSRHFRASTAISYTDTKVQRFSGFDQLSRFRDFAGSDLPFTPKWRIVSDAEYRFNEIGGVEPFVGSTTNYSSTTSADLGGDPLFRIKAYTLLDVQAGFRAIGDRLKVTVWGRNVTNETYTINTINTNDAIVRYTGRPATYGVSAAYRF